MTLANPFSKLAFKPDPLAAVDVPDASSLADLPEEEVAEARVFANEAVDEELPEVRGEGSI
jgi:hypothetical protein